MASAGSKSRGRPPYRSSNASVLSSDFCIGTGDWSASYFPKIFRTCSRTSSSKPCENDWLTKHNLITIYGPKNDGTYTVESKHPMLKATILLRFLSASLIRHVGKGDHFHFPA